MAKIQITKDGAKHGPFTAQEVNAKLKAGEFASTDKAWIEGAQGWLPLSDKAFKKAGVVTPSSKAKVTPPPEPSNDEDSSVAKDTISKPKANPMLVALITFFLPFYIGHVMNGQPAKCILSNVFTILMVVCCCCCGIGLIFLPLRFISALEAYKTAERLKNGEEIGKNEYSIPLFYKICKVFHKKATCQDT
jgi:hypothetical protein